ncbi:MULTISPECIES: aldo/keto reductase [unclassified Bradyrhizobium]|uniref:aldo/keto reductase n=1 Tax=unclassified Bradyrhizobium TaxID=2631580 RepID=UPI002915F68D|nr:MULTISPECIES: aldo/keto reductase [unclassified Bradyrhizobium]
MRPEVPWSECLAEAGSSSRLGLGTYNFDRGVDEAASSRLIAEFIELGGRLIDTSNSYAAGHAEHLVGLALKGRRHEQAFVATKVGWPLDATSNSGGLSRSHVTEQCEASLRRLNRDCIDLYQLHRPDPAVPIEETLLAMADLKRAGKIAFVGTSNFSAGQLARAVEIGAQVGISPISEQSAYNLLDRRVELDLIPCCKSRGVSLVVWGALAGGMLTGKYQSVSGLPAGSRAARSPIYREERLSNRALEVCSTFCAVAAEFGYAPAELGLRWVLTNASVRTVVIGPKTSSQLGELMTACEPLADPCLLEQLDRLVRPGTYVAPFYEPNKKPDGRLAS